MSDDWKIRFGTAGTSDSFAVQGYKTSLEVPEYTAKMGLNAFEYQCGRGVRLGLDKAARMAALAAPKDILFSVHAPYYISMSSLEEDKRLNSIQYLLQSAAVCRALGGKRIIFHSGSCGKQSREAALEKALDTMRRAVEALDEAGFADMTLCPEIPVPERIAVPVPQHRNRRWSDHPPGTAVHNVSGMPGSAGEQVRKPLLS